MVMSALPGHQGLANCSPTQPVMLVVTGGYEANLAQQATARGVLLASPEQGRGPGFLVGGEASEPLIRQGLSSPASGFLELTADGMAGVGEACFQAVRDGGLALSLTTRAAFSQNTLDLVMGALRARVPAEHHECLDMVEICLGEAISNAVMHGNLEVPGFLRVDAKGFALFRKVMQERLQDPALSERRVEITIRFPDTGSGLTVAVSDQGKGFNLEGYLGRSVDAEAKSGRGLTLISQLCASFLGEDQGRRLVMTFV